MARRKNTRPAELPPLKKADIQRELDRVALDMTDDLTGRPTLDREQALAESIRLLGNTKDIDTLSELDNKEIAALCAITMMSREFDIKVLDNLRDDFIRYRVSKQRRGRKGIEDILKSVLNEKESFFGKLRDRMNTWT